MKRTLASFILPLMLTGARAGIIAQWNFNSPTPDSDTGTGTLLPSSGQGTALFCGGTTSTFATGCTNDPAPAADNSGWNTSSYATQGTSNKMTGVQFNVSTLGYSDIVIRWDHRVSSSASKYCRLQYCPDGATWTDYPVPVAAMAVVSTRQNYFEAQTNSLVGVTEVENCAGFSFRIVAEWESTAVGGSDNYIPTYATNNYSRNGTIRFDMVTVSGTPIPGANTPPGISGFSAQTLRVGHSTGPLPFNIWDAEDTPESLTLLLASSNESAVPAGNLVLGGSGNNRTLTVSAGEQPGISTVTVAVLDSGGLSNHTSFQVTVLPLNTAPVISGPPATNTLVNTATADLPFTVGDLESPAESLTVSGSSANSALIPNDATHIVFGGSGSNRTVSLIPATGQTGVAPLTLTVSDGTNNSSAVFPVLVTPSAEVLFYDPFEYPDGSLLTNSAFLWEHRSGVIGQAQVTHGKLQVTTDQTEDVIAPLIGGPYARSNSTVLYASLKATFLSLPKEAPALFAHFADGSMLRGRIYAGTSNAMTGFYRLFVANGSNTNHMIPANLSPNVAYTVVTRYDLDAASTTVWLNPSAETDPGVTADDPQSAVSIASYGFRQDSDLGATLLVDDLRVGLSFASVLPPPPTLQPIPLTFERRSGSVVLRWTNANLLLQSAPGVRATFTNVPGATSPFTNATTGTGKYFRLKSQL
jgi:hypothetical protein